MDPVPTTAINWQPLIDLLGKSGAETSEYQHAKSSGRMAQVAFWIGLIGLVAGAAADAFGAQSKIGIYASLVVTVSGLVAKIVTSNAYVVARTETKASAGVVATAIVAAAPAAPEQSQPAP